MIIFNNVYYACARMFIVLCTMDAHECSQIVHDVHK